MFLHSPQIVKSSRKITAVIVVFITIICMAHFKAGHFSINEKADRYYQNELHSVKEKLTSFKSSRQKKVSLKILQQQFLSCRLAYKKLAVLSEYFTIYETKFLNGPALNRVENGTPDIIIPPKGFQAIEEILFSNPGSPPYSQIRVLLEDMLTILKRMENEPDRIYQFRDELVWDAMRSAILPLAAANS